MAAVDTQLLATEADLGLLGPLASALGVITSEQKVANLRRASGEVLAAYGKRFGRAAGSAFALSQWGTFTKGLVVDIASYRMLTHGPRGLNPSSPDGRLLADNYERAMKILDEIADLTNPSARVDPDAVGSPDGDDMGPLSATEGGDNDEADHWTHRAAVVE